MKLTTRTIWLFLICGVAGPGMASAQKYQPKDDCAFLSSKRIFHIVGDDQPLRAADLEGLPPTQRKLFVRPAAPHPVAVAASEQAYAERRFSEAAAAVAKLAVLNPADPNVLNCYARALYRDESTRNQSYSVYQKLIGLLDGYGQEGPEVVSVYTPFLEAYFKLATLELDNAHWTAASYHLSRAAAALQSIPDALSANSLLREQILQYQTECFSHLNNASLCRYFGLRTLQFYPNNQYVLSYLATLPPTRPRR